jgi:hypothetical protein
MPTIGEPARPRALSLGRLMTKRILVLLTKYSAQYFAVTLPESPSRTNEDLAWEPLNF